jgi:hypothetical protein
LAASAARSQEKPTAAQCRTDFAAWKRTSKLETDSLGFRELQRRFEEMTACTDGDNDWQTKAGYALVSAIYCDAMDLRHMKFLVRNHLMQQFLDEDAAGQQ